MPPLIRHPRPARRAAGLAVVVSVLAGACAHDRPQSRAPEPTVAGTSVTSTTAASEPPVTTSIPTVAPTSAPPAPRPPAATLPRTGFGALMNRAIAVGVPGASEAVVVASACYGDEDRPHWGYFNNGALGGAISEPDGAVVPLYAICLNPNQPDAYSSLLHELGHRWFWVQGQWYGIGSAMGGVERAAECFARHYGATTFGQGGCSAADADRVATLAGL